MKVRLRSGKIERSMRMEKVTEDIKDFVTNDTTQKFMTTVAVLTILTIFNLIPKENFVTILKWSVAGFWGANGLDFLTNLKR